MDSEYDPGPYQVSECYVAGWNELPPDRVEEVISTVKTETEGILEIVYDPLRDGIAAFRVIAYQDHMDAIVETITELIGDVQPETGGPTQTDRERYGQYRHGSGPVLGDEDIRKAALQQLSYAPPVWEASPFDSVRFPDVVARNRYRAAWKDLQLIRLPERLDINSLLLDPDEVRGNLFKFGDLVGCDVTMNSGRDILYLGSESQENVNKALSHMRQFLYNRVAIGSPDIHLVCSQTTDSHFVYFRKCADANLFRSSILDIDESEATQLYHRMFTQSCQIQLGEYQGRPHNFNKKAPLLLTKRPLFNEQERWAPFDRYRYLPKTPGLPIAAVTNTMGALSLNDGSAGVVRGRDKGKGKEPSRPTSDIEIEDNRDAPGTFPLHQLATCHELPERLLGAIDTCSESRDKFAKALTLAVKHLASRHMTSNDKIELRFTLGRILINEPYLLAGDLRDQFDRRQFLFDVNVCLRQLAGAYTMRGGTTSFLPIVSTLDGDMVRLTRMVQGDSNGDAYWSTAPIQRKTLYEFTFRDERNPDFSVVVGINAETFEMEYREEKDELGHVYVHFPQQSWDFKASVMAPNARKVEEAMSEVATHILKTLEIRQDPGQDVKMRFSLPPIHVKQVVQAKIRHVAKYTDMLKGRTYLYIDKYRRMSCLSTQSGATGTTSMVFKPLPPGIRNGVPATWFQVSISSADGEELFAGNAGRDVGEAMAWTMADIDSRHVVDALINRVCPLMGPLHAMGLGCHNDNGMGVHWGLAPEKDPVSVFW